MELQNTTWKDRTLVVTFALFDMVKMAQEISNGFLITL